MSARILVVDDVEANAKLLEARLAAEYFDVVIASSGAEALEICARGRCDIVLLDVMMPAMDGFEVCRRLKTDPRTMHLPVVMITALDSVADKVAGLDAGADDFLAKPLNDLALLSRVRSLTRLKLLTDELSARAVTSDRVAIPPPSGAVACAGKVFLVDDRASSRDWLAGVLAAEHAVVTEARPEDALFRAAEGTFDLAIVSLELGFYDGLRLCSQLRALERTRAVPILVVDGPESESRVMRALDLGVNDYLMRPVDRNELLARVRSQIRRKRTTDQLRDNFEQTIELAITDSLTGLYNRRYFERRLEGLVAKGLRHGSPLSLLTIDVDHFKAINDAHGHAAGDAVLRQLADRLRRSVRVVDLAGRFGGEEFLVAMPETEARLALLVGERIRDRICREPFAVGQGIAPVPVTVSIGVASLRGQDDTPQSLMERCDEALYRAKHDGRNRVVSAAA